MIGKLLGQYDVLCLGSATVDSFLSIDPSIKEISPGDKVLVNSIEKHSGGGATNSAAALSKMGLKVKILTKLGKDHDAEFILKELKQYHIKNISRHHSKQSTDFSTIISSKKDKNRVIFNHKGASLDLSSEDFKKHDLGVKWLYLATLMGKSFQTAKEIVNHAYKKETNLLFNPSLYLAKKGRYYLDEILLKTNILVLNKEEAQAILKQKTNNIKILLKELAKIGPEIVIITDGPRPLYGLYQNQLYSLIPPIVDVVDTAGAGDAFTSGFLAGWIKKYPFEECLKIGQANANSVIQYLGTKNILLTEKEALEILKKYSYGVKKHEI